MQAEDLWVGLLTANTWASVGQDPQMPSDPLTSPCLLLAVCTREHPTNTLGSAEVRPGFLSCECVWVFIFLGC